MVRISGKVALTQIVIVGIFLILVILAHALGRTLHKEVDRIAQVEIPIVILAGAMLDEVDDLTANLLEYVAGEAADREAFEENRSEFLASYEALKALEAGQAVETGEVAILGRLFALYEAEARARVFERYDPALELWAAERVDALEAAFAAPLERLLDEKKAGRAGGPAPNSLIYAELIDEVGDMMEALQAHLRGVQDGARRFEVNAQAFSTYFEAIEDLGADERARLEALFGGLASGGRAVLTRYDPGARRVALLGVESLERGVMAEIEAVLEQIVADARDEAGAGLTRILAETEESRRIQEAALVVMLLVAALIILISLSTITRPIERLQGVMRKITSGEPPPAVPHVERGDEIGEMARAVDVFKQNRAALEEKTQTLEALPRKLGKYLSPQVFGRIFAGATQVEVRAERKKLTIFFCDVVNFTETVGDMEPEEVASLLNEFLSEMSAIALAHGATIDKYIGDAILAFFGDPESRGAKEDARACVAMAIAMQARMRELAVAWRERGYERPFAIRVGINTGYCDVGNFGSADRMDYTIIGGAVNLAARLQSLAAPGGIVLAYETWAHVQDDVKAEPGEPVTVKGIRRPITPYHVVAEWDALAARGAVLRAHRRGLDLRLDLEALADGAGDASPDALAEAARELQAALDAVARLAPDDPRR